MAWRMGNGDVRGCCGLLYVVGVEVCCMYVVVVCMSVFLCGCGLYV